MYCVYVCMYVYIQSVLISSHILKLVIKFHYTADGRMWYRCCCCCTWCCCTVHAGRWHQPILLQIVERKGHSGRAGRPLLRQLSSLRVQLIVCAEQLCKFTINTHQGERIKLVIFYIYRFIYK